jgi:hypothetical protein
MEDKGVSFIYFIFLIPKNKIKKKKQRNKENKIKEIKHLIFEDISALYNEVHLTSIDLVPKAKALEFIEKNDSLVGEKKKENQDGK